MIYRTFVGLILGVELRDNESTPIKSKTGKTRRRKVMGLKSFIT
jgi:hypothetical protein